MKVQLYINMTCLFGVVLIAAMSFFTLFDTYGAEEPKEICFGQECFAVELALTPAQKTRGLMGRTGLGVHCGMLFIYKQEEIRPFWMKNMLMSLDIIWLDKDKKVVFIKHDATPCVTDDCTIISPAQKAQYVLELLAHTVEDIDLQLGDRASFK